MINTTYKTNIEFDKAIARMKTVKRLPEYHSQKRTYVVRESPEITAETIKRFIKIYPHAKNMDIAKSMGLEYQHITEMVKYLKKEGVKLEPKRKKNFRHCLIEAIREYKKSL